MLSWIVRLLSLLSLLTHSYIYVFLIKFYFNHSMDFYAIIIHICNMDKAGAISKIMIYVIQYEIKNI